MPVIAISAVLFTVFITVLGQVLIKYRLGAIGGFPAESEAWPKFFFTVLTDVGVLAGLAAAFVGAMAYLAAISRFHVSYLYPFASLSFPLILLAGWLIFGEPMTWQKALGSALIVTGVAISATSV